MGKKRKADVNKANEANKNGKAASDNKDKMSPPASKKKKDQKDFDSDGESGRYSFLKLSFANISPYSSYSLTKTTFMIKHIQNCVI